MALDTIRDRHAKLLETAGLRSTDRFLVSLMTDIPDALFYPN